jgi:hypothetical protein
VNNDQLARWGQRYGLALHQVKLLGSLCSQYAREQTHACNGDYHPSISRDRKDDKQACSDVWEKESDKTRKILVMYALECGFSAVDFGVGLYPALIKESDTCIMVP